MKNRKPKRSTSDVNMSTAETPGFVFETRASLYIVATTVSILGRNDLDICMRLLIFIWNDILLIKNGPTKPGAYRTTRSKKSSDSLGFFDIQQGWDLIEICWM
jgi:hypothetical protein